jgi:hypothetical protein
MSKYRTFDSSFYWRWSIKTKWNERKNTRKKHDGDVNNRHKSNSIFSMAMFNHIWLEQTAAGIATLTVCWTCLTTCISSSNSTYCELVRTTWNERERERKNRSDVLVSSCDQWTNIDVQQRTICIPMYLVVDSSYNLYPFAVVVFFSALGLTSDSFKTFLTHNIINRRQSKDQERKKKTLASKYLMGIFVQRFLPLSYCLSVYLFLSLSRARPICSSIDRWQVETASKRKIRTKIKPYLL